MADSRILMDTLGLLQQLGVIPAPPPGKLKAWFAPVTPVKSLEVPTEE